MSSKNGSIPAFENSTTHHLTPGTGMLVYFVTYTFQAHGLRVKISHFKAIVVCVSTCQLEYILSHHMHVSAEYTLYLCSPIGARGSWSGELGPGASIAGDPEILSPVMTNDGEGLESIEEFSIARVINQHIGAG